MQQARQILKEVFGYSQFRPLQEEVIKNILEKRDTLAIMPTGGGKSLCYQIPALLFEGITVVVSPLISLMKDQVEQLNASGVEAVFLNSSLARAEYERNVRRILSGEVKLLYVAPETLMRARLIALLESLQVDCLTIDEAHCISEWGHDFRPDYRQLIELRERFPGAVCVALTATATPRVQQDIRNALGFQSDNQFIASFDRKNLLIRVVPKSDPLRQTVEFLRGFAEQSGIIYCFSRRQVDELAEALRANGFSALPYHAGLSDDDRRFNQELFIRDDVQIIVATIAFGMGINKPNVRFVVHYDLPKNIEGYYQEIGRAGRDGLRSECLLLFGYGDRQKIQYFIDKKEGQERRVAQQHLDAMIDYAESMTCRRKPLLAYFGEQYSDDKCDMCDNCHNGETKWDDLTIPAQMFLSCVKRTGEMFGAGHVVKVLRGSTAQKVLKFGHDKLSTYGIGKDFGEKQWLHMSRQFLRQGLLEKDREVGSLQLTAAAYEVLKKGEKVYGKIEEEAISATRKKAPTEYDENLYRILRRERKDIADRENVPPYIIFADRSLMEMAASFPRSEEEMLQLHGVGKARYARYGKNFQNLIEDYCRRHNIPVAPSAALIKKGFTARDQRRQRIAGGIEQGQSIDDMARQEGIKPSTVINHLYHYYRENPMPNGEVASNLLSGCTLPKKEQSAVLNAFNRHGCDLLRPVFEALNETIAYEDLHLLRLVYLARQKTEE